MLNKESFENRKLKDKQLENKKSKNNLILGFFIIASILFAMPSIIYYIQNKTILKFEPYFKFLLTDSVSRIDQTIIYIAVLGLLTFLYFKILKNRKEIFNNTKKIFIFIAIIAIIFILVVPFISSDIFYYIGVGRIDSKYHQNPYYTTIKEFVQSDDNSKYLEQDTVLQQGYINDWSDTTVVYGPIWTLICKLVAGLSFGNIDIGLFVFKLVNVIVHLLNCYLIYKISGKKFFTLLYGLNPFILIEGIACVHNDMFMILFILLAFYFLLKKKNLAVSVGFLAIATAIKYFAIILLPFMIIYYFREEKPLKRFARCIEYGALFLIIFAIPYLFYVRDLQVFSGLFVQQEKFAKSFYIILLEYFGNIPDVAKKVNTLFLGCFVIIYFFTCVILLNKKQIKFRKEMQKANYFIMAFLFLLITNFQPWYIMWLFPALIWQKSDDIRLIVQISLVSQFANSVFLINGEGWKNGTPFVFVMVTSILGLVLYQTKDLRRILFWKN